MREICEKSAEYRELGRRVLKEHPDLAWIKDSDLKIGYITSDHEKKSGTKLVYAECIKVQATYKAYIPYDFLIKVYEPNVRHLEEDQKAILMYHELLHIGMDGNGSPKIVPHDIEDFRAVLYQYGLDWAGDANG